MDSGLWPGGFARYIGASTDGGRPGSETENEREGRAADIYNIPERGARERGSERGREREGEGGRGGVGEGEGEGEVGKRRMLLWRTGELGVGVLLSPDEVFACHVSHGQKVCVYVCIYLCIYVYIA